MTEFTEGDKVDIELTKATNGAEICENLTNFDTQATKVDKNKTSNKNHKGFETKVKQNATKDKQIETQLLYEQIEMLKEMNKQKDLQIQKLNDNLTQALTNLDQQQKLSAMSQQKIYELEAYKEAEENKTFFQRLFYRKNKS